MQTKLNKPNKPRTGLLRLRLRTAERSAPPERAQDLGDRRLQFLLDASSQAR
jgi:hypothetical protein